MLISVGNKYETAQMFEVRTKEQREVVKGIVQSPEFDFACSNPFEEGITYQGTFVFLYFTKDGKLNLVRISPTGRITKKLSTGDDNETN